MLKRLIFSGVALSLAVATSAAVADPPPNPAFKRTVLQKVDFPAEYQTVTVMVEMQPDALIKRHTHPGVEMCVVTEGEADFTVDGDKKEEKHLKAGDSISVPANTPHYVQNSAKPGKLIVTYVIDKGKDLATPAPKEPAK